MENLPGEVWKWINEEQRYAVSSLGRMMTTKYKAANRVRHEFIKPAADESGYLRTMIKVAGRNRTIKMHRIIAEAFILNPDNLPTVNHLDFNPSNNEISNLEWASWKRQAQYSYAAGRIKKPICTNHVKGSKIGTAKLTEDQVREIRAKFKPREYGRKKLAEEYGVSPATIKDVILRRWRHVA